jgi:hypothetical protein
MNIKEKISIDINVQISFIDEAINNAHKQIKKFHISKRKGGYRVICQPSAKLKTLQYWVIKNICNYLPVDKSAYAYIDGVSILHNALFHASNKYFLKVDLKDFFPSISFDDFIKIVRDWYENNQPVWELDKNSESILKKVCFDEKGFLPIGYPSSPSISNAVMYPVDLVIKKEIEEGKYGKMLYTRYADDLIFSTDKKGECRNFLKELRRIIKDVKSPKIKINESKTNICSSSAGSAIVTGLRIANDSHITIHKKQKDHIRLLLSLYKKGILKSDDYSSLLGYLAYVRYVDSAFYSKIQHKFFKEIDSLRKSVNQQLTVE